MTQSAAQLLAATLATHGVDVAYCVPGESYLAVTDALIEHPDIRLIVCRHEGGAGFMALADARIRGKAGVCFISRGPGATNVSIAIHSAFHDAIPAVFFVGQVERFEKGRLALQEMNYTKTFSDTTKAVFEVDTPEMIAEIAARAFHLATSGTPGPVVVALPEDMLDEPVKAPVLKPVKRARMAPDASDVDRVAAMLAKAERPLVVAGGLVHSPKARAALKTFAETFKLPVSPSHRRADVFDSYHANYGGYLGNRAPKPQMDMMRKSDLLLVVGERMGPSVSQGFSFPTAPVPQLPMVHVWPDPLEVGRVWHPEVGIAAEPELFLEAMLARGPGKMPAGREDWIGGLHKIHRSLTTWEPVSSNDGVVFGAVVAAINERMTEDAVVTSDAGNFSSFLHRYLYFRQSNNFVGYATGGMGGGVPSGVAAGICSPGRQIVTFVGDGGFLMTGNELATAVQYDVPIKIFIANNNAYGTIRMHQEGRYPGRVTSTDLKNPDFAKLGEAFGARGFKIDSDADVAPVVQEALSCDGPAVIDVRTSLNHLSAYRRLQDMPAYSG
jgi:thiamine pyrophosphate-dependent acetolactate synthase large subunit-like protein